MLMCLLRVSTCLQGVADSPLVGSVTSPPPRVRSRSPRRRSVSPVVRRDRSLSRSPLPRRERRVSPIENGYSILFPVKYLYKMRLCWCFYYHIIIIHGLELEPHLDLVEPECS